MQTREWGYQEPLFAHERWGRTWLCLGLGLVLTVLLIPVDVYFARELLTASKTWKFLRELPIIAEFVGSGFTVFLVLTAVALADLRRRPFALSTILIVSGAGLTTNFIKLLTVRLRPRIVNLQQIDGWDTFLGPGKLFEVAKHDLSFPSGHTTTAFALAYIMTRYYPGGRPIFLLLAVCTGIGRVVVRAHYPSDIVMGAIVGWGFSMMVSRYLLIEGAEPSTWPARWMRIFRRLGGPPIDPPEEIDPQKVQSPGSDRTAV